MLGAPLERVEAPVRTMVVVLDALDELPPAQLGVVLQLIVQRLALLPQWLRLFVTSRDTVQIKARLARFEPLELRIDEQRNREDVGAFLTRVARRYVAPKLSMAQIERIVEREFGIDLGGQLQALEEPMRQHTKIYERVVGELKRDEKDGYARLLRVEHRLKE